MHSKLLTLIGFTAFVLCPNACPMMESVAHAAEGSMMHHEEHVAHHDMEHREEAPCDHCESHASVERVKHSVDSVANTSSIAVRFMTHRASDADETTDAGLPKTHLATAGPSVVPGIVRTIVLRT